MTDPFSKHVERAERVLKGAGWFDDNFFFAGSTLDALWATKAGLIDADGVTDAGMAYWSAGKSELPPRRIPAGEPA